MVNFTTFGRLRRALLVIVAFNFLLIPVAAHAQNVDILKIFKDMRSQHNPNEAIKYFADDATLQFSSDPPIKGKAAILAASRTTGLFDVDPTEKIITPAKVEGNKVIERSSSIPPELAAQGVTTALEVEVIVEFQGDKIKSVSFVPTAESLAKLAALQGQGGAPGAPNTGAGGATQPTTEGNPWLIWVLIASGAVIILASGTALVLSRRTGHR